MVDQSRRPKELVISWCISRDGGLLWRCSQCIAWGGEAAEARSGWLLVTYLSKRLGLTLNSQRLSALSSIGSCRKGSDFPLSFLMPYLSFIPVPCSKFGLVGISSFRTGMQNLRNPIWDGGMVKVFLWDSRWPCRSSLCGCLGGFKGSIYSLFWRWH